jgi:hypothetical protein
VDPVKFSIVDYFDIVSKPMDFSTIRKKLNFNVYTSPKDFVADVRLIFKNCYAYNGNEHEISNCAKEIETLFEESLKTQGLNKFLE